MKSFITTPPQEPALYSPKHRGWRRRKRRKREDEAGRDREEEEDSQKATKRCLPQLSAHVVSPALEEAQRDENMQTHIRIQTLLLDVRATGFSGSVE